MNKLEKPCFQTALLAASYSMSLNSNRQVPANYELNSNHYLVISFKFCNLTELQHTYSGYKTQLDWLASISVFISISVPLIISISIIPGFNTSLLACVNKMYLLLLSLDGAIILAEQHLHILTEILKPAATEWKTIGLALGFLNSDLTIIEHKPLLIPKGVTGFFSEMLSQWLKWAPPDHPSPTLENLAPTLQRSGHEDLAVRLTTTFPQRKGRIDNFYNSNSNNL